jgi:hypothetical protein
MKRIEDVLDASTGGMQISLDEWLSAQAPCVISASRLTRAE